MHFPWNRMERELERELAHHLHHLTAEFERQGYSHRDAQRMAKRAFGGSEQVKEMCREESPWASVTGVLQDLRFGFRMLRRTPVVTLAAILSLALGIGANTAIVSLMDVVLWRDLPVPAPQQLDLIHWQGEGFPRELSDGAAGSMWKQDGVNVADFFPYASFELMRKGVAGRASVAAFTFPDTVSISFAGKANVAQQRPVSGNFFSTLRVRPALGRLLSNADDRDTAPATTVLTYRFWSGSLAADPGVIGKIIRVNNQAQVIVGVLEPGFFGLNPGDGTEMYAPLHHSAWQQRPDWKNALTDNRAWMYSLLLRRNANVTANQLQPAMQTLFQASWSRQPKDAATAPRIRLDSGSRGLGFLRRDFQDPLLVLGGLVALLLIIACTNIANLLLARAVARQREVTVRVSLGCSRWRLVRQFITESALLASAGGVLSIGVGFITANLLGQFLAERDGQPLSLALDLRVLLIVGAITMLALVLFGLFPAFQGSRIASITTNRPGLGGVGVGVVRNWSAGRVLIVAQVAMSVVLVMAAVIFTRNLLAVESSDPGFDRRNLVLFGVRPGTSGYDKGRLPAFYANLEQRLATTPGVTAVGMAWMRPMNVGGWWETVRLPGQSTASDASINGVNPDFLPVLIPHLVAGRNIQRSDIDSKTKVAVISEDLAAKLGKQRLLGQMLEFNDGPPGAPHQRFEIIGIAPAIAATSLKDRPYAVWVPMDPDSPEATIVARTTRAPQSVLPAIRQTMKAVDPNLPLVDVMTMEEQIAKGLQRERMFAILCSAFGALALALSAIGLYGVISYNTSKRRAEIGVRLALGALPRDVLSMVLRDGLGLAVFGMLLAAPVVWFGAHYIEKLLVRMKPIEPASVTLTLAGLFLAALLAVGLPALRASAVNPSDALREE